MRRPPRYTSTGTDVRAILPRPARTRRTALPETDRADRPGGAFLRAVAIDVRVPSRGAGADDNQPDEQCSGHDASIAAPSQPSAFVHRGLQFRTSQTRRPPATAPERRERPSRTAPAGGNVRDRIAPIQRMLGSSSTPSYCIFPRSAYSRRPTQSPSFADEGAPGNRGRTVPTPGRFDERMPPNSGGHSYRASALLTPRPFDTSMRRELFRGNPNRRGT